LPLLGLGLWCGLARRLRRSGRPLIPSWMVTAWGCPPKIFQHPGFEAEAAAAAEADVPAEARGGGGAGEDEDEDEDEGDGPHEEDRDAWDEALVAHNVDARLVD